MGKKKKTIDPNSEQHITILGSTRTKLEKICEHENRKLRTQVTMLIEKEYDKLFGKGE